MLREVIRPTDEFYNIRIPKEYINKDIEILLLPSFAHEKSKKASASKIFEPKEFYGASSICKKDLDEYLSSIKNEWE